MYVNRPFSTMQTGHLHSDGDPHRISGDLNDGANDPLDIFLRSILGGLVPNTRIVTIGATICERDSK